jgi:sugar/nucleoside kinase (ribokinase family)
VDDGSRVGSNEGMSSIRDEVARSAADHLESAVRFPAALIGFDGFLDSILDVVDVRRDMTPEGYEPIRTIEHFARRIGAASGKSMNLELVEREERWGGNGPLLAGVLGRLGAPVTYIGAVGGGGNPPSDGRLHPAYAEFATRCRRVVPIAPPARTRALEFSDGKVMLNEPRNVQEVTWLRVLESVGGEAGIIEHLRDVQLLGIVNWSLMGGVEGILRGLEGILPRLSAGVKRRIFIDLTDPAKRTDQDIAGILSLLARLNRRAPVTLGLNIAEAERIARVAQVRVPSSLAGLNDEQLCSAAAALLIGLNLDCLVVHRHRSAVAAVAAGGSTEGATFAGPFVARPRISTGAGDHFNGGFALAQILDMPLAECLAVGCAVAGLYVREAQAPGLRRLLDFLRALPQQEPAGE